MNWEDQLARDMPRGNGGPENKVPNAHWADPRTLGKAWDHSRQGFFLGYRDGKALACNDDRHIMVVAGSRAGKGVSFVVPNLLLYDGSVLATDPKGELAQLTARARQKKGHAVYVLDPFDVSGSETYPFRAMFNPLLEIDREARTAVDDAVALADALIVQGGRGETFWTDSARELIKVLILHTLTLPKSERHLGTVRGFFHQLSDNPEVSGQIALLGEIAEDEKAYDGLTAGLAQSFMGLPEKEFASIVSEARVQTAFLDSLPLRECLTSSSFSLADLKRQKATVYLCLPASRMSTHAKWFRAIVELTMLMCERVPQKPKPPLLLMLDEFPVMGHMKSLEVAAGQIAGFGVRICTILQDLTQLQRHYGKSWETFLGNSGAVVFFGNADVTTLTYVSKKLGVIGFDVVRDLQVSKQAEMSGSATTQEQLQSHHLLEPHEVELMLAREYQRALVLYPGISPLIVKRADFRHDEALKALV